MPRTKPKERLVLYVRPENLTKIKTFACILEDRIDMDMMSDIATVAKRVLKQKNNTFKEGLDMVNGESKKNKPNKSNCGFGISAEDFIKSRMGEEFSQSIFTPAENENHSQELAVDYTEWQNSADMKNIYQEVNYDMSVGYVPLTEENARFVSNEGKELYSKLRNGIYTPGFDINKAMTEIYNLWRETNA